MVPLEAMPGSSHPGNPPRTDVMLDDFVTPTSGSSDLAEFEVPVVETGICQEELTTQEVLPTRWVLGCDEPPGS